jgi:hypothetical protein
MYDVSMARVAALYRSGSSTDSRPIPQAPTPVQAQDRARLWQAELAKSMANIERRRRPEIVSAAHPVSQPPLRPAPGMLIVGSR